MIYHVESAFDAKQQQSCTVWYAEGLDSGHLVHFEISRENVIRCIWIDTLSVSSSEDEYALDSVEPANYIM